MILKESKIKKAPLPKRVLFHKIAEQESLEDVKEETIKRPSWSKSEQKESIDWLYKWVDVYNKKKELLKEQRDFKLE